MGKAERNRQQNARQRVAMQQAAARRAESQRRAMIAGGSVLLVIVIVVAFIVIKSFSGGSASATSASSPGSQAIPAVAKQITTVSASEFDQIGAGSAGVQPLKTITSPALTSNGKPEMLYIGAEYCPFCAAERWAMVTALSRFGTFTNLHFIHSDSNDVYSNTSTLTFYKSTYTSKYVDFVPVETLTVDQKPLMKETAAQGALINKYSQGGSIPFVDIDGKYIISGAQYQPDVLGSTSTTDPTHFGLTWQEIGKDIQNPSSSVAQSVIGAANHITAAICKATNNQPSSVCSSKSVTAIGGDI